MPQVAKLQVGELARLSGKSVRAVRLYQEHGLLGPEVRSSGGFRLFDLCALERLRWIDKLQELGFTLQQIGELLAAHRSAPDAPSAMRAARRTLESRLARLRRRIEGLQRLEAELARSIEYLQTCDACDPPRLHGACPQCDQPRHDPLQPGLVAGLAAETRREL